eukprot:1161681-Pelagomonas_calceolata.AAC.24
MQWTTGLLDCITEHCTTGSLGVDHLQYDMDLPACQGATASLQWPTGSPNSMTACQKATVSLQWSTGSLGCITDHCVGSLLDHLQLDIDLSALSEGHRITAMSDVDLSALSEGHRITAMGWTPAGALMLGTSGGKVMVGLKKRMLGLSGGRICAMMRFE